MSELNSQICCKMIGVFVALSMCNGQPQELYQCEYIITTVLQYYNILYCVFQKIFHIERQTPGQDFVCVGRVF